MPSAGTIAIKQPKLLLVEGKDEVNFFTAVLQNHLNLGGVQVLDYGGKTQLSVFLKTLAADPAFSSLTGIGIIRDADLTPAGAKTTAAAAAWDAVRGALTAIGVACPAGHAVFAAGPPRVGAFIMPDGVSDGMLESLCLRALAGTPELTCVDDFFVCCAKAGAIPNNPHKGQAYAWLACRPEPDKRVGEAALAGYWPFAAPAFSPLWDFLRSI
jgi:hypothetical protein